MTRCPFIHDNIDTLYGVPLMPYDQLPKKCICGADLTYADFVCFINTEEKQDAVVQPSKAPVRNPSDNT